MKLVLPKEKLVAQGLGGLADVDPNAIRGIGAAEVAGAIVVHGRRKEYPNVAVNVVLLGLALFVAWGRFGAYAF